MLCYLEWIVVVVVAECNVNHMNFHKISKFDPINEATACANAYGNSISNWSDRKKNRMRLNFDYWKYNDELMIFKTLNTSYGFIYATVWQHRHFFLFRPNTLKRNQLIAGFVFIVFKLDHLFVFNVNINLQIFFTQSFAGGDIFVKTFALNEGNAKKVNKYNA